jgi:hypothetical protein
MTSNSAVAYLCSIARQSQQSVVGESTAKSNADLRLTIGTVHPSLLLLLLAGMLSLVVPLRPSSEHILIVRASGAVGHVGFPSLPFFLLGGGLVEPQLRATFSRARPLNTPKHAISPCEGLPILSTSLKGSGQGCP